MNECLECGREMRRGGAALEDFPGTVQLHGRGLCKKCWDRLYNSGELDTRYPVARNANGEPIRKLLVPRDKAVPCETCSRLMRPPGTKVEDWPDTVGRKGRRCTGCCSAGKTLHGIPVADVRKMREDLKDWFHSRGRDWRKAGIPA